MKRKLLILLLAITMCFVLVGCGEEKDTDKESKSSTKVEEKKDNTKKEEKESKKEREQIICKQKGQSPDGSVQIDKTTYFMIDENGTLTGVSYVYKNTVDKKIYNTYTNKYETMKEYAELQKKEIIETHFKDIDEAYYTLDYEINGNVVTFTGLNNIFVAAGNKTKDDVNELIKSDGLSCTTEKIPV